MHRCPLVVFFHTARLHILGGFQRRVVGPPRGAASPVKERRESIGWGWGWGVGAGRKARVP